MNGLRFRTMINELLWPELEDMDVDDVYFQQDSATCHKSGETIVKVSRPSDFSKRRLQLAIEIMRFKGGDTSRTLKKAVFFNFILGE